MSDNAVWHLDGGMDSVDPSKKGYLQFDLQSSVSGALFRVVMNIVRQNIVKVEVSYDDLMVLFVDDGSVSPSEVVDMLNWDLDRVLDKMIECTKNKALNEKIAKKKVELYG